ncbi:MAG TPA: class I adenylate-forming enzyme family protein [Terriglobales bacterium]|nr:class I adenylate-forming enzyme family protein [Terriglobales bacterium]
MLLTDLLAHSAERFPGKAALVFPDDSISFGALHEQSDRVASRLSKLGIGRGSRVAVLDESSVAAVIFFWGSLKAGAHVVDVPYVAGVETIADILDEAKPAAIATSERYLNQLWTTHPECLPSVVLTRTELQGRWSLHSHSLAEITATEPATVPAPDPTSRDVALIIYTSGSTGRPKGVMLSHDNLISNITAGSEAIGLSSDDSILLVVPLHFIHGRMQLLTHALVGGTMFFSTGFQFPQRVVDDLARYRVTGFSGVPYHYSLLLKYSHLVSTRLPRLRYVLVTGGAMSAHGLQALRAALPKVSIHIAYGQTEASPRITHLPPSEIESRPNSCGMPLPCVRLEILDGSGVPLPPGEIGEVVVSGPGVMCGYLSGDEITTGRIDRLGRLHTGDLGRLDSEGYLYLVGRSSDLIKVAGERVFPREIESVLETHPAISEAAVFGLPDDHLGERIVACAVLHPGRTVDVVGLRQHCLRSLPLVRVPREVVLTEALPKTSSGKIDRSKLAAHYHDRSAAKKIAA